MRKNNLDKEIDDIVRPVATSGTPWLAIGAASLVTGVVVIAILYFGGFLSRGVTTPGLQPNPGPECIAAVSAKDHVGKNVTVCGTVVSATYAIRTRRRPTFLNLDKAYPNQVFTIVIWDSDRPKFGTPESDYRNKQIAVTGTVETYRGTAEIIVSDPSQIKVR